MENKNENKEGNIIMQIQEFNQSLKKMDDIKTKNIYILTGMKPYSNIKNFLAEEEKANG